MPPTTADILIGTLVPLLILALGAVVAYWVARRTWRVSKKVGVWVLEVVAFLVFLGLFGKWGSIFLTLLPSVALVVLPLVTAGFVIRWLVRARVSHWQAVGRTAIGLCLVAGVFMLVFTVSYFANSVFRSRSNDNTISVFSSWVFRQKVGMYLAAHGDFVYGRLVWAFPTEKNGSLSLIRRPGTSAWDVSVIERGLTIPARLNPDGTINLDRDQATKINLWWLLTETFSAYASVQ